MIYLLGGKPIQNLLRINAEKDKFENLNRAGVEFARFTQSTYPHLPTYSLISKVASLAAAKEKLS